MKKWILNLFLKKKGVVMSTNSRIIVDCLEVRQEI